MTDDPFVIATEHIAWCIQDGMQPADFYAAVEKPPPSRHPTWNDAIWTAARLQDDMGEASNVRPNFPGRYRRAA